MLFPWDGTYLRISNASGYFRLQGSILELTLVLRLGEVQLATRASWRLAEALSRAEHRVSRRISVALQAEGMALEQWRGSVVPSLSRAPQTRGQRRGAGRFCL